MASLGNTIDGTIEAVAPKTLNAGSGAVTAVKDHKQDITEFAGQTFISYLLIITGIAGAPLTGGLSLPLVPLGVVSWLYGTNKIIRR